jgi:selenocysteine lyase/cysteine desulfurase
VDRRQFLRASTAAAIAFRNDAIDLAEQALRLTTSSPIADAEDEDYWSQIQRAFSLDRTIVNFNNGGVCPSPTVVQDALRRYLEYSNQAPSYFMWRHLEPGIEAVRLRLARAFGCDAEEIAITRNASEALETCLFGLTLNRGDEVLTTTQDYPRMIATLQQRERRDGIRLVQASVPHKPDSHRNLVEAIEAKITSATRLILFSHVAFLNGQIYPVREIVRLGRRRGIPVVVDGAHAFAQFPVSNERMECDYYGVSLHKWLMAPVGTGFLYVRREKIGDLWSLMASKEEQSKDIRKFEEIGTHPAANHNAISEALTFNEAIGFERKAARLRYLRSLWALPISGEDNVEFHTSLDASDSCGITTVGIRGIRPERLAAWLFEKKRIFVTTIDHPDFAGVRVTPNVYTTIDEVLRFRDAMLEAARTGIA